jgi:hypothetical protein
LYKRLIQKSFWSKDDMNSKLKRFTAGGLMAVMLLVGFIAEYTHRHVMPLEQASVVHDSGQPVGKPASSQIPHDCFVCQLAAVAIQTPSEFGLFILNASHAWIGEVERSFHSLPSSHDFLRRGPPALLA